MKKVSEKEYTTVSKLIELVEFYGLEFTNEALEDLESNVVDFINDNSYFHSAEDWFNEAIIEGLGESMFELFKPESQSFEHYFPYVPEIINDSE